MVPHKIFFYDPFLWTLARQDDPSLIGSHNAELFQNAENFDILYWEYQSGTTNIFSLLKKKFCIKLIRGYARAKIQKKSKNENLNGNALQRPSASVSSILPR